MQFQYDKPDTKFSTKIHAVFTRNLQNIESIVYITYFIYHKSIDSYLSYHKSIVSSVPIQTFMGVPSFWPSGPINNFR